ncbi:flavodoxin family protein [Streptomyces nitrosporeus]|uniref:Flavodoxin n=1 Tax=Streptomyces nitrosporeus TaxID=28894 RepID=A0A5J6FDK6_9ACTN|nr:NAD(P)H-dependent oxidoreductase [Streptomyces nitrosporeus]QEU72950.1 flavodoxin [Streptomyces nitrosporeus]GGZ13896.1 flavodoxin [Streptomyces nitrosporeus]
MTSRTFLFLLGSGRADGNTEALARLAAEQLPAGTRQHWLSLRDLPLPEFEDLRHPVGRHTEPTGHAATLLEATLAATDVVIVSPLYWYSVTSSTKRYLDHWSSWLEVPGIDFAARMAGKTLWGVSTLADDDPSVAEPLTGTLRHSAGYLGMRWGGTLLGNGSRPGDVLSDTGAVNRAKTFFS